jgi:hypothetical protein
MVAGGETRETYFRILRYLSATFAPLGFGVYICARLVFGVGPS